MEERSLLEGKRCEHIELDGRKYTAYELSAKKAAKVASYVKKLISYVWKESLKEENQVKEMADFIPEIISEVVYEFIDQAAFAVSESVVKENGEYITMLEAENLSLGDLTILTMGFLEANAYQINQIIELDIKKKLYKMFPGLGGKMEKYLKVEEEAVKGVPKEEPEMTEELNSTPTSPTES